MIAFTVHLDRTAPDFWKHLAPINQKHIDFILVNRSDFAPQVAIELDGGSHNDKARQQRDSFIDSVFRNAGIPLVHILVKPFYQYTDIRRLIEAAITSNTNRRSWSSGAPHYVQNLYA